LRLRQPWPSSWPSPSEARFRFPPRAGYNRAAGPGGRGGARFAFWTACGLSLDEIRRVEDETVLAEVEARYHAPAAFYEELQAAALLTAAGRSSLHFAYRVTRRTDGALLAEGRAVLVYIEPATGRSRPLPASLRERLPPVPTPPARPSSLA